MKAFGAQPKTEKRGIVVSSGKRPAIVIYGGGPNKDHTSEVWFDLRTCNPTCASNCKLAAVHPGHAARRGNELKDDAWAEVAAAQGSRTRTRTRTNTIPDGTKANTAGLSGCACVTRMRSGEKGEVWGERGSARRLTE